MMETPNALERFRVQFDPLPPGQHAVVILRDVERFSIWKTAEQLEISEAAVKMRLTRARATLRRTLRLSQENEHE